MNKRTPKAEPQQAEVIQLADRRPTQSSAANQGRTIEILLPAGAKAGDRFEVLTMSESVSEWKVRKGDHFITLVTDDVERGDVVGICEANRERPIVGTLDFDECCYYIEETSAREEERFHRAQSEIIGRVIEVRRDGRTVKTTLNLRPLHPPARIYQFKRRA
jgi:hypothetical protein